MIYARPIVISHFDKCKQIDLTRDDPLPIDKVPLIIMTDRGFLLVKRQEHHRPVFDLSPRSAFPAACLTVARNLVIVALPTSHSARVLTSKWINPMMKTRTRIGDTHSYTRARAPGTFMIINAW